MENLAALGAIDAAGEADAIATFQMLDRAYRQPWRHYHDRGHVTACLTLFDDLRSHASDPAAIEFALWLHDAVYVPRRSDNEARSAIWARSLLARWQADEARRNWIAAAILATRHGLADRESSQNNPPDRDTALLLDIDLAILAAPEPVYDRYLAAIRREYSFVNDAAFREGRRTLLESWLGRDRIFHSAIGIELFEARTRHNLQRELDRGNRSDKLNSSRSRR